MCRYTRKDEGDGKKPVHPRAPLRARPRQVGERGAQICEPCSKMLADQVKILKQKGSRERERDTTSQVRRQEQNGKLVRTYLAFPLPIRVTKPLAKSDSRKSGCGPSPQPPPSCSTYLPVPTCLPACLPEPPISLVGPSLLRARGEDFCTPLGCWPASSSSRVHPHPLAFLLGWTSSSSAPPSFSRYSLSPPFLVRG